MKIPDFTDTADKLLTDLAKYMPNLTREKLVEYIRKDLEIAYLKGYQDRQFEEIKKL